MASKNSSGTKPPAGTGSPPASTQLRQAIVDKVTDTVAAKMSEKLSEKLSDRLTDKLTDKITTVTDRQTTKLSQQAERVTAKAEKLSAQAEKLSAHAARTAERIDRLGEHLSELDVWMRVEPMSRKPRFTREEIAVAAVHIADTEGLDALSMRRLAAELDAGTMTLYHYVRTKDELLTLALDQVMAEVLVPGPLPSDWRDAMVLIASASRRALLRHSWVFDIADDMEFGPNSVRHFDQSLEALSTLPVSMRDRLDILMTVDEYVFGHCLQLRNAPAASNDPSPLIDPRTKRYLEGLISTGDFPQLAAWVDADGFDATWRLVQDHSNDPDRFARNLERILDGIQTDLDQQTARDQPSAPSPQSRSNAARSNADRSSLKTPRVTGPAPQRPSRQ